MYRPLSPDEKQLFIKLKSLLLDFDIPLKRSKFEQIYGEEFAGTLNFNRERFFYGFSKEKGFYQMLGDKSLLSKYLFLHINDYIPWGLYSDGPLKSHELYDETEYILFVLIGKANGSYAVLMKK